MYTSTYMCGMVKIPTINGKATTKRKTARQAAAPRTERVHP